MQELDSTDPYYSGTISYAFIIKIAVSRLFQKVSDMRKIFFSHAINTGQFRQ
jgi:hypothetical protein